MERTDNHQTSIFTSCTSIGLQRERIESSDCTQEVAQVFEHFLERKQKAQHSRPITSNQEISMGQTDSSFISIVTSVQIQHRYGKLVQQTEKKGKEEEEDSRIQITFSSIVES